MAVAALIVRVPVGCDPNARLPVPRDNSTVSIPVLTNPNPDMLVMSSRAGWNDVMRRWPVSMRRWVRCDTPKNYCE